MKLAGILKQNSEQRTEMILSSKPAVTLLIMAVPQLLMSAVQSLIPVFDGYFIYNYSSLSAAAAISFSNPILMTVLAIGMGLGIAGTAILGQRAGKGNAEELKHYIKQFAFISFFISIIGIIAMLAGGMLTAAFSTDEIRSQVLIFFAVSSLGVPFYFFNNAYIAIKTGTGRPEIALYGVTLIVILKAVFNYLFIYKLKLGAEGAALSSVCTNSFLSFIYFYDLFFRKKREFKITLFGYKLDKAAFSDIIKISLPSIAANALLFLGFFLVNIEILKFGQKVLNGINISNNINALCFNVSASFGAAITTLVSINVGAGNNEKARKTVNMAIIYAIVTSFITLVAVLPFAGHLVNLFSPDLQIRHYAKITLEIFTWGVPGWAIVCVYQGVFIGLTRTKMPLYMGILRIWIFRYLFILASKAIIPNVSFVCISYSVLFSNTLTAVAAYLVYRKIKWENTLI